MNISPKTYVNAIIAALNAHAWTLITAPAVKKGPQESVSEPGNIVVVCIGDYEPEATQIGNVSLFDHNVLIVCLVPWDDTDLNEDIRLDFIQEVCLVVKASRQVGGSLLFRLKSIHPFVDKFFGPKQQQYRGFVATAASKDVRS
jgi:hypothetical protein